ncbi:hypothetical protein ACN6MY_08860 [Peribacillus sp. B-H-3]
MAKGIFKKMIIAAAPLIISQAGKYLRNRKRVKNMQQANMVK